MKSIFWLNSTFYKANSWQNNVERKENLMVLKERKIKMEEESFVYCEAALCKICWKRFATRSEVSIKRSTQLEMQVSVRLSILSRGLSKHVSQQVSVSLWIWLWKCAFACSCWSAACNSLSLSNLLSWKSNEDILQQNILAPGEKKKSHRNWLTSVMNILLYIF